MKQILLIGMLAIAGVSCTKSVQNAEPPEQPATRLESASGMMAYIGSGENRTLVTVKAEPYVVCESYQAGQDPKPCDIFVSFTCTLSQPLNSAVRVEIARSNLVQVNPDPVEEDSSASNEHRFGPEGHIICTIPANSTTMVFRSTLRCLNNNEIPENQFKIISAGLYKPMN
jgi:hypothetical protein